ncbi:hypothetical protein PRUPE_2G174800, partial [Prunus persica]
TFFNLYFLSIGLLPPGSEATVDVPFEKIDQLKFAYDHLQQPIKLFIGDQLPDWLILDFAPHWAVEIGQEYGVPLVFFSVFSAATMSILGSPEHLSGADNRNHVLPSQESLTSPPDWVAFPSLVAYREHEAVHVHKGIFEVNGSGISDSESCNEFEGEYLEVCQKINGKPVIPTGFLPPEKPSAKREIIVFVGFGSECKLSEEQVFEIAHGLELSELPFLWALRKLNWPNSEADALPPGFVERTSEKGLVCLGWAPQMDILGHPSVGGSLFHSGWGSVIETLQFGHVLVVLPFIIDQPLNARLLVEKDLAVEVKRTEDGSFCKDDIAKTLRHAMVAEEGEKLRNNARKAAKVFGDHKLHQDDLGQFINVVMLPWSAFGHMVPFFQLSIALAKYKIAYDLLQQPIKQFIGAQLPDWIIVDFSAHRAVEIGKEFGVPLVYFSAFCAATCVFLTSLENISKANTDHDVLPSPESLTSPRDFGTFRSTIAYRKHEAVDMHAVFYELNDSDGLGISHPGGSLFHSGWGSVIDSLQIGHVLVVLPFIIDQPLNARLLVEKDLAVEVKRTEDWSFCKDDIAKTLRHAMVAEDGEKLRSNARKAAKVFGVTSSTKTTTLANLSLP